MNPIQAAEDVLARWKSDPAPLKADGRQHASDLRTLGRGIRRVYPGDDWHQAADVVDNAADHIEHQAAELARKSTVSDAQWEIVESFKKENAELRAALEKVRNLPSYEAGEVFSGDSIVLLSDLLPIIAAQEASHAE